MDKKVSSPLGTAPMGKLMIKMALPTVVAQIVNLLYNIVDRIYIGHIEGVGADALTGVGLCLPLLMMVNAFALLGAAGGAPRAAIALGQGNREEAERIMGNCATMLLLFSVVITTVYLCFAERLLWLFGASEFTISFALEYMNIYSLGTVFVLLVLGLNTFLTAQGFSNFAMLTTVIGAVINIILDPILIFAFGMGVKGAAIATVISQAVSAVWVLWFLTKGKKTMLRLRLSCMKLAPKVIVPCLLLGISGFVMLSTESILSICFNTSLQGYGGDLAVGSMTIITSCAQLALMPTAGICQGCQPITSYNFGAGNTDRVKQCVKLQLMICGGYTTVFWLASMFAPRMFVQIFNSDPALVEHTVWALRIYMAGIFAMGFQTTCQQCFMALGQAAVSLLLACLRKLILLIPLIYILPSLISNQVFAVFLAEPVCDILAATVTVTVFFTRFNQILREGPKRI
jgi:putative MATE family efflux protein